MIKQSDVTIVIPHLGADEQQEYAFKQCFDSLKETVPDIKIITVTNGDHQRYGDINIFEQGQCKATNAAVATTNTPWVFITNDDMIYSPGWWDNLGLGFTYDTGFVCPKLIEPRPGAPTFEVFFAGGAGGDFDKAKWLQFAREYDERDEPNPYRTGFNLPFLIRRDIWDTVGGYDINYDPWGSNSDSDLEYKIKLAGIQPYQNPNSIVYHFSQTSGTFHPSNDSHRFKNYAYFKNKWGFDRTDDGIWEASFTIPTKEEGRIYCPKWEGVYA